MGMDRKDLSVLVEVADILAKHGRLRCAPRVELDDGEIVLTVAVTPEMAGDGADAALDAIELFHELERLEDVAQLRALCEKYDIPPADLERLLPKEDR